MRRRRRRGVAQLSLSFLDCMSCGLGAVILLFMIIHHATEVNATATNRDVADNFSRVESEVLEKRQTIAALAAALKETEQELQAARAQASSLEAQRDEQDDSDKDADASQERIAALSDELKALERQVEKLRAEQAAKQDATRRRAGQGRRQYLTGLTIEGQHILILLDASASMLGETLVDVIRSRNLPETARRGTAKWRRAVDSVDWITTQVPADSRFQLYTFNTSAQPALSGTAGQWQTASGGTQLTAAVRALDSVTPAGGTSLANVFAAASALSPRPDSIYLITDGLPTQGASGPAKGLVSGERRARHFRDALGKLPGGVPVNVILLPMEGDPMAASAFWQLAQSTDGAFLSPSSDWP